jgi:hypothetical protein
MREKARASEADGMDSLVYQYRIGQLMSILAWLDECKAYLEVTPPRPDSAKG